jgi:hypothetical protein
MAKLDSEKMKKIHSEAIAEFGRINGALRDERLQCLQDRRFYSIAGAQWEGPLGEQFENKPKFEVNKIHLAVIRIINEYRNNRISVNFVPKDGSDKQTLSDTCNGLYRADEQDSTAEEAYDNAFEEAVGGGFGAWRLRAEYEDDESEDDKQRIKIEPIFDADSTVFFDLDAKRQDKADAKRCYVLTAMSHEAYEEEYDDNPASWGKLIHQSQFDWLTPDVVYIAEYYVIEKTTEKFLFFKGLTGDEKKVSEEEYSEDTEMRKELKATGYKKTREKDIKSQKVHKYIMNGRGIIEDCGYIAGKNIPIVPMYGKRWFIDNVERCMGHVRLAKDAQRLKNMQLSKLGEISALSTVEKPIFSPEQMQGHALMWSEDNVKNYPYMLLNSITDANGQPVQNGPIGYTKVATIPPAMAALLQITEQDIQDVLGNQEAGEEIQSNVSGIAMELVQNKLDMQTFIYISNMAKAVKRSGEIWLSMAKELFIEEGRKMKTINDAGEVSNTIIGQKVANDNGVVETQNDLTEANFDVTATPGPTSASKRAATVRSLTGMMQLAQMDPQTMQVLIAMSMLNMEGEGIQDIRDYFRKKLLQMGVVAPTKEEAAELQQAAANQQPDPQSQFLLASAEQAKADALLKQANTVLASAKAELTHAQAAAEIAGIKTDKIDQTLRVIQAMENSAAQPQQIPAQTAQ